MATYPQNSYGRTEEVLTKITETKPCESRRRTPLGKHLYPLLALQMRSLIIILKSIINRLLSTETLPTKQVWGAITLSMPLLKNYTPTELEDLRHLVGRFLHKKAFYGCENMPVDDRMKLLIAVQACIPVLKLGFSWYRGWSSVVIYANEFRTPRRDIDSAGVVHESHNSLIGEAWPDGPVVLSWPHVREGALSLEDGNVVIHEFAHKLDMLNGQANGMPPLHRSMNRVQWTEVMTAAFNDLNWHLHQIETTTLNAYAAKEPAEFFARISEAFFVEPNKLQETWPAVYEQLSLFYKQNPLTRFAL